MVERVGLAIMEPYLEQTEERYSQLAATTFTVTSHPLGVLLLSGPCPQCAANIVVPIVESVFRSGDPTASSAALPSVADGYETIVCNCEEPHAGRPDGLAGCGAYWRSKIAKDEA